MASPAIEEGLRRAEAAVDAGEGLAGTGFWRAVSRVKSEPELADRYADRIAAIDTAAHRNWALVVVPLWLGTALMVLGTFAGLGLVGWAYALDDLAAVVVFYLGLGILLITTHGLAHLVVGRLYGIRFTSWFIGTVQMPQPGVKVDYSSYLRAGARGRAWMHAAGAIATKILPFALIGAAVAAGLPDWAVWLLPVIGLLVVVTDVVWSTKKSDWMKFRREMASAQDS